VLAPWLRTVVLLLAAAVFGPGSPALRAAQPPATATLVKAHRLLEPKTGNMLSPDVTDKQRKLMRDKGIYLDLTPTWFDGFRTTIHEVSVLSPAFRSTLAASDERCRQRSAALVSRVLKSGAGSEMCWFYPRKTRSPAEVVRDERRPSVFRSSSSCSGSAGVDGGFSVRILPEEPPLSCPSATSRRCRPECSFSLSAPQDRNRVFIAP
jgi:hypothetical protein